MQLQSLGSQSTSAFISMGLTEVVIADILQNVDWETIQSQIQMNKKEGKEAQKTLKKKDEEEQWLP
jgi:hypothetical protein